MPHTYIWIQFLEKEKIKFSNPLGEWIREKFPGITALDFDNYSEKFVVDPIIDQAAGSEKLIVDIHAAENVETGPVTRFMNRLTRKKTNILIVFSGHSPIIEKMIGVFDQKFVLTNPGIRQVKEAITGFLSDK